MYNTGNDNSLEQFSRDAAEKYEVPASSSWVKLERALDKEMPLEEKKRRRFLFWWLFPYLLAGGMIFWWFQLRPATSSKSLTKKPTTVSPSTNALTSPAQQTAPAAANTPTEQEIKAAEVQPLPGQSIAASANKTPPQRRARYNTAKTTTVTPPNLPAGDTDTKKEYPVVTVKADHTTIADTTITAMHQSQEQVMAVILPDSTTNKAEAAQHADSATVTNAPTAERVKPPLPKRSKGFSLALLTGVDLSTVKFRYADKAGINIGMTTGYHFNERWSVHTGAIYTQKNYKMAGADFTAPKNSWIANYPLETVDGYCRMWEIPLLARYSFTDTRKKNYFISTGLSSYFMTRENYNYYYYFNNQLYYRNNNYSSQATHILSILHLSTGLEKRFSKSFSLLMEPYAKLPLAGLGFGSIKLSSFGINLAVQYRQPSHK